MKLKNITNFYNRVATRFFQILSRFSKFPPGFKKTHFGSIFSLKLSLRLKTMLNSIKTLKRYCKVTFNVFFNKKIFW